MSLALLLEARHGRRADLGQRRQLPLRQRSFAAAPDRFVDKCRPIKVKVPFHLRSIRSSKSFPRASSLMRFAASMTAVSTVLRRPSSFLTSLV